MGGLPTSKTFLDVRVMISEIGDAYDLFISHHFDSSHHPGAGHAIDCRGVLKIQLRVYSRPTMVKFNSGEKRLAMVCDLPARISITKK